MNPEPAHDESVSVVRRDVFVARQPVLNLDGSMFAYELLFRDGVASSFPGGDGHNATSAVLLNAFVETGLPRLSGEHRVLINFNDASLIDGLPTLFPKDKLIVEILEDVTPSDEIVSACRQLVNAGYELAMDDFRYTADHEPLLQLASMIKFDFINTPEDELAAMCRRFRNTGKVMLGEKIETPEMFERARDLGCTLFQGYFFSKPELIRSASLQSNKVRLLQILAEVASPDYDVHRIEKSISSDVAISYKLLRYINSALFHTAREVSSIRHAITLLGRTEFKKFIGLLLAGEIADHKPLELTRLALVRGKFCEALAEERLPGQDSSEFFLLGLLSMLDAMLDMKMADALEHLPLSPQIRDALLYLKGPNARFLELAVACEMGDWDAIAALEQNDDEPTMLYWDAVEWADHMLEVRP